MWFFLALLVGVIVSRSHLQGGCLWPVLLALFSLVIVLGGLLLADAAGVAVLVLDHGVSGAFVLCLRFSHVYFWFVVLG